MTTSTMLDVMAPPEDPAKGLFIRIYNAPVENKAKTREAGYPVLEDVPHIQVKIPGDPTFERNGRMTEEEKQMYPRHWRAFCENQKSEGLVGLVLEEWSPMPRSMVETLRFFSVRTVEQLASLSDANANRFPQGRAWRDKAKAWLESAKAAAPFSKLEADNKSLQNKVDALQKQLEEAMKALDKATAPKR